MTDVRPTTVTDDRERWNAKFLAGEAQSVESDPLLVEVCAHIPPGRALDLAGGAGRHALWLAQRGWHAVLSDISDEGLAIAAKRAADAGVGLTMRREPAAATVAWASATERFDLILVFWCLLRENFPAFPALLAPGGLLLYKTYTTEHARYTEGHSLFTALHPGELRAAFPALNTISYREIKGVAELVAQSEQ
ncbi:MAG: methyltransferase domain-containing protein [Acidobacteriaceae bacterium]|jgi:SAM-dependent methyltransferase